MRRLLKDPPQGAEFDLTGKVVRATIKSTYKVPPLDVVPYQPYFCPLCGADAGLSNDRKATILALESEGGTVHDFLQWSHRKCFEALETSEFSID